MQKIGTMEKSIRLLKSRLNTVGQLLLGAALSDVFTSKGLGHFCQCR